MLEIRKKPANPRVAVDANFPNYGHVLEADTVPVIHRQASSLDDVPKRIEETTLTRLQLLVIKAKFAGNLHALAHAAIVSSRHGNAHFHRIPEREVWLKIRARSLKKPAVRNRNLGAPDGCRDNMLAIMPGFQHCAKMIGDLLTWFYLKGIFGSGFPESRSERFCTDALEIVTATGNYRKTIRWDGYWAWFCGNLSKRLCVGLRSHGRCLSAHLGPDRKCPSVDIRAKAQVSKDITDMATNNDKSKQNWLGSLLVANRHAIEKCMEPDVGDFILVKWTVHCKEHCDIRYRSLRVQRTVYVLIRVPKYLRCMAKSRPCDIRLDEISAEAKKTFHLFSMVHSTKLYKAIVRTARDSALAPVFHDFAVECWKRIRTTSRIEVTFAMPRGQGFGRPTGCLVRGKEAGVNLKLILDARQERWRLNWSVPFTKAIEGGASSGGIEKKCAT